MSRSVRIGDYAYITVGDQEHPLLITDVGPSYIIAGDYTLIPVGDRWIVQNYPVTRSVRFASKQDYPMDPLLHTHIPEIMSQILLSLNYNDLINACKTNKDFNKVCRDDYFWKLKVERDYGMITEDKPSDITYRQQYVDLMTIEDPKYAAFLGRLDILKWLGQQDIYPDRVGVTVAARYGQLEVLKWLAQHNIYPDQKATNSAAIKGQLEVLKWLAQTRGLYPDRYGINNAILQGRLKVLKWLVQVRKFYPSHWDANTAASNGHVEVLQWLAENNIYPDEDGANRAAINGRLEVLRWLAENDIFPDQNGVNMAVMYGQLEVLELLAQYDIYPNGYVHQ